MRGPVSGFNLHVGCLQAHALTEYREAVRNLSRETPGDNELGDGLLVERHPDLQQGCQPRFNPARVVRASSPRSFRRDWSASPEPQENQLQSAIATTNTPYRCDT
jgi:hypothetical protein